MKRWTPNSTHRGDPEDVLREAMKDAAEARHALALQKHLWFHKYSTKLRPSLSGVRRSYALVAWKKLGDSYPPARTALLKVRSAAARAAKKDSDPWQAFHDLSSINDYLKEPGHTLGQFLNFHRRSAKRAARVYNLVEPLLFESGQFKICARYLEPAERFARIRKNFRVNLRMAKDPAIGKGYIQFTQRYFVEKTTRLIALLALNARTTEAKQIACKARRVWSNRQFHQQIALALHGKVTGD